LPANRGDFLSRGALFPSIWLRVAVIFARRALKL